MRFWLKNNTVPSGLRHIKRSWIRLFFFFQLLILGMQKGVLHQKQPYGLPLRFTTLSQKLKEAGKSIITLYYYMGMSQKDWKQPNSRIWLAKIDLDRGLDFPI